MTKTAAENEAKKYVERVIAAQGALGYKRPQKRVVSAAVDEAAAAIQALSALATKKH